MDLILSEFGENWAFYYQFNIFKKSALKADYKNPQFALLMLNDNLDPWEIVKYAKTREDWYLLSKNENLSDDFIDHYIHHLTFDESIKYQKYLEKRPKIIQKLTIKDPDPSKKLELMALETKLMRTIASMNIFPQFFDILYQEWNKRQLSLNPHLTESFFENLPYNQDMWYYLSNSPHLSLSFFKKHRQLINIKMFSLNPSLTPEFVLANRDMIDKEYLCMRKMDNKFLKFLRQYPEFIHWTSLVSNDSIPLYFFKQMKNIYCKLIYNGNIPFNFFRNTGLKVVVMNNPFTRTIKMGDIQSRFKSLRIEF